MKKIFPLVVLVAVVAGLLWAINARRVASKWGSFKNPDTVRLLQRFTALKQAQVNAATNTLPPEISAAFKKAGRGDWLSFSNSFWRVGERNGNLYSPPKTHGKIWTAVEKFVLDWREKIGWRSDLHSERLRGTPWEAIKEVWGAFDAFVVGDEKYAAEFGREIIDSIPAGSIYFGGTDPGRFIVTALCSSQPEGEPFFTLTQNALADSTYLDYLRAMYGKKIYIPTPEDQQACFQEYARSKTMASTTGHVTISGQSDVMAINGLLVKTIFDQSTNREFFIEESFPLGWMYPNLEPHGLIFKINRAPLTELSDAVIQRDRDYWRKSLEPKIGGWLTEETSVEAVAAFVRKIFIQHDFAGFTGDIRFVRNDYTCKIFSKERSSLAGLYAWRAEHATNEAEKKRMTREADFAFRQAWALCPYSPEAVYRYVNLLLSQNRQAEALRVAETAAQMPQMHGDEGNQLRSMVQQLKQKQP